MVLFYGNQTAGGGYISLFGKASINNTAYGKLGESLIFNSVDTNSVSLLKENTTSLYKNDTVNSTKDIDNLFKNIGNVLDKLIKLILEKNYDELEKEIKSGIIEETVAKIEAQQTVTVNPTFQLVKETFNNIAQVVSYSYVENITYQELAVSYDIVKEQANILADPVKLQVYIEDLKKQNTFYLFNLPDINTTSANVKPEYEEYFRLYGVPDNLEFEQDKLDEIINRLY
jgi:hypothetical protein